MVGSQVYIPMVPFVFITETCRPQVKVGVKISKRPGKNLPPTAAAEAFCGANKGIVAAISNAISKLPVNFLFVIFFWFFIVRSPITQQKTSLLQKGPNKINSY